MQGVIFPNGLKVIHLSQLIHLIHELYLEPRSCAWTRWRREFTKRQNVSDTKLTRAHWYRMEHLYDEAVARVVARHTYDESDGSTLTGTPSNI